MWQPYLLLFLIPSCFAAPTTEQEPTTDAILAHHHRDLTIVTYIQTFKTLMTDYVRSQYTELTHHELEQITDVIEDFLTKFSRDLRDVVDKGDKDTINYEGTTKRLDEEVYLDDNMNDAQFEDLKLKVKAEFPDMDDAMVDEVIKSLRKNLFETRQKLDKIINSAKRANIEYAKTGNL